MVDLACVPPDRLEALWPHISPLIRKAVERGGTPAQFGELAADVLVGRAMVWIAGEGHIEAVAVTTLFNVHGQRICYIAAVHGLTASKRWLHLLDKLEDYARAERCVALRLCGRKGWRRVLKDYREPYVVLEKELD